MKCEICQRSLKLNRDHCHKTNLTRGLLCTPCNVMLGLARDNIEVLEQAIDYLEKYSEIHKQFLSDNPPSERIIDSISRLADMNKFSTDMSQFNVEYYVKRPLTRKNNVIRLVHKNKAQDIRILSRNFNQSSVLGSRFNWT